MTARRAGLAWLAGAIAIVMAAGTSASAAPKRKPSTSKSKPAPAVDRIAAIESIVLDLTNVQRRRAGLPPFAPDRGLAAAARRHSADMARRNYFDHATRGGGFDTRIRAAGVNAMALAENIAMQPVVRSFTYGAAGVISEDRADDASLATDAVANWMKSPGHRRNILNGGLTAIGVGVAMGDRGGVPYAYLTQDFGGGMAAPGTFSK